MIDQRGLFDVFVVGVVGVLVVIDVTLASYDREVGEQPVDALAFALVIFASISLFRRRQNPIAVLAIVTAAVVVFWLRGHGALLSVLGLPPLFAVAAHAKRRRRAWLAIAASFAMLLVTASASVLNRPEGFDVLLLLSMAAFLAGAVAAGVVVRNRAQVLVDAERRVEHAEADRIAAAERAGVEERRRIAREMHDVVAHTISVIAVQAAAGREIVHANPDKAEEIFARVESAGRESLTELRRMLGVLRDSPDDVTASLSPQPGIDDIAAAVDESVGSGVATELTVHGPRRAVGPGVGLAAYRIVQEALTNVRRHAGPSAHASVRICFDTVSLAIEIVDDGTGPAASPSGGGHGVIGMRERVEIYGGTFMAGHHPGGGYLVRAVLPAPDDLQDDPR